MIWPLLEKIPETDQVVNRTQDTELPNKVHSLLSPDDDQKKTNISARNSVTYSWTDFFPCYYTGSSELAWCLDWPRLLICIFKDQDGDEYQGSFTYKRTKFHYRETSIDNSLLL